MVYAAISSWDERVLDGMARLVRTWWGMDVPTDPGEYLARWAATLLQLDPVAPPRSIRVTGAEDRHLGPRWSRAKVVALLHPADSFEVVVRIPERRRSTPGWEEAYVDWCVYGFLDILALARPRPMLLVRLELEDLEVDPVNSTRMAFRWAGRLAGLELLAAEQHPPRDVAT